MTILKKFRMSKRKLDESAVKDGKRKAPDTTSNQNSDISSFLTQLSDYEKNVSNNPFKAKAYKKAAHTVSLTYDTVTVSLTN